MSTTLFKEVNYSLSVLLEDIDMGEIGLPDIQRPFVWKNTKVRDLFDSMYKGFPIGYLLFWANANANGSRQIGSDYKQSVPRLLIVDGQQRLTALYAVLKDLYVYRNNYNQEKIHIGFRPSDGTFEVTDAAIERDPEFIPDISQLWSSNTTRNKFVKQFLRKLRDHRDVSEDEEDFLTENIDRLYDIQKYPFTAMELSSNIDEEQVAEVFVRINSKGKVLNQADFILTLMSVYWDQGRRELETFCRLSRQPSTTGSSPFNYFIHPDPDQLLRVNIGLGFKRARLKTVYSVLRGKDLETGDFNASKREQQFEILQKAQSISLDLQNWHDFFNCLKTAGYKSGDMISSKMGLIYSYTLFLIGRKDFQVNQYELRNSIARWFFMTALTGRYSASPETSMEGDLTRLRDIKDSDQFLNVLDRIVNDTLTEDFWNITLPNELASSAARSPALYAYYAALNLLDAKVLFSNMKVGELLAPTTKAKKSFLERHHLFPKNYLNEIGYKETRQINQIANYALVEWWDNISISDSSPVEYFPEYVKRFDQNEEELKWMMYWHALPEDWHNMDYPTFLEQRRKKIAQVVRDGFNKLY